MRTALCMETWENVSQEECYKKNDKYYQKNDKISKSIDLVVRLIDDL